MKRITIITVDIDVIVIALNSFWNMRDVEELWIEFRKEKGRKWISIHIYANTIGQEMRRFIPFWYAFYWKCAFGLRPTSPMSQLF